MVAAITRNYGDPGGMNARIERLYGEAARQAVHCDDHGYAWLDDDPAVPDEQGWVDAVVALRAGVLIEIGEAMELLARIRARAAWISDTDEDRKQACMSDAAMAAYQERIA